MPTGSVKWFDDAKGYGFIAGEDGKDIFVHHSAIQAEGFRTLKEGDTVEYELTSSNDKGPRAERVSKVT